MATTPVLPTEVTSGMQVVLPVRLKPKCRQAVPAGSTVEVMGTLPTPLQHTTRLLLWLPHGEARVVPWANDAPLPVVV